MLAPHFQKTRATVEAF
nr:hypothetical protein [Porphyromonas gulae]